MKERFDVTRQLFNEFDRKMFKGNITKREKHGILIAETARLDKILRDTNIAAIEKTMSAIFKKEGKSGLLKILKEEKTLFESLLPKEMLNEIFICITKK